MRQTAVAQSQRMVAVPPRGGDRVCDVEVPVADCLGDQSRGQGCEPEAAETLGSVRVDQPERTQRAQELAVEIVLGSLTLYSAAAGGRAETDRGPPGFEAKSNRSDYESRSKSSATLS